MKSLRTACLTLAAAIGLLVSGSQDVAAQSVPYIAFGQDAQYNPDPTSFEYSGQGFGFPFGSQSIAGTAIPIPGEDPPGEGVFFEGPFVGEQVIHTFLGDIYADLSGEVLLTFTNDGLVEGTWTPTFEIDGGTGIFRNATGTLNGVAVNPPFDPLTSATWPFDWAVVGRIHLNLW